MSAQTNVLISSAGRRVALLELFAAATAPDGKVFAADMTSRASAFQRADRGFKVPRCTSPDFVPVLRELCREHEIALVIPTIDTELPVLAEHRAAFAEAGTMVSVSSPETIAIASDKHQTHAWLVANGFPTVKQTTVAEALQGAWPLPTLVKPARGSSSIGVQVVDTPEALALATQGADYVVQSIATGVEYTVDTFVDAQGCCHTQIPRLRLAVRAGEVSKGRTERVPQVQALAREICERLPGAFGCLNVQIFWDEATQTAAVIEINPRFGGGFPLSHAAGARFVEHLVASAAGRPTPPLTNDWRDGLLMLRYDDAVFVDATTVD